MNNLGFSVEVDRVTEPEWSELMDRFEDASIYQTWAYGAVRWGHRNLSHLVLKHDEEVVAIAQLRIIRPQKFKMGIAYLRWGPLCHLRSKALASDTVQAVATSLHDEYVAKRGLYLEILPCAFSGSTRAEMFHSAFSRFDHKPGLSGDKYRTLILDLSPALEELRKKLDRKWRNHLNAAERKALTVTAGDSLEEYRIFSQLYDQLLQRKKFETNVSVEEFGRVQERLPAHQRMRILICWQGEKPIAGLVVSTLGESAIYLLGATSDDGMQSKGAYLLQWDMIRWLKENGIRYYDLGGIDPEVNPGVHHFKNGLSGSDMSHIDAFTACDNHFSATLVKAGQIVRRGLRGLQQRIARPRLAVATRWSSMACGVGSKRD